MFKVQTNVESVCSIPLSSSRNKVRTWISEQLNFTKTRLHFRV